MNPPRTAASKEEAAELSQLSATADHEAAEAAHILTELSGRLAQARQPGAMARRLTGQARASAIGLLREGPGKIAGQRGAKRAALAAIPVLVLAAAIAVGIQQGKITPAAMARKVAPSAMKRKVTPAAMKRVRSSRRTSAFPWSRQPVRPARLLPRR